MVTDQAYSGLRATYRASEYKTAYSVIGDKLLARLEAELLKPLN